MGSCCGKQTFRFKNLVTAVYPDEPEGEINKEALNKLRAYVANNPERIPKVCHKINKLVNADLVKNKVNFVQIGAWIMKDLVDNSTELEFFVPYTLELCLVLLKRTDSKVYPLRAAELLALMAHQIAVRMDLEQPRRLLAATPMELFQPLRQMAVDGIGTNEVQLLHIRYAAITAMSNLCAALQSRLVEIVPSLVEPTLMNLQRTLKDVELLTEDRTISRTRRHEPGPLLQSGGPSSSIYTTPELTKIAILPADANLKDLYYRKACVTLLSSLAACCTTSSVSQFVGAISNYLDEKNGWSMALFPQEAFRSVVQSLQRRQQLGFTACHHLIECTNENPGVMKLRSLFDTINCVIEILPLSGARPATCFEPVARALSSSAYLSSDHHHVYDAAIQLLGTTARRTTLQGNLSQLTAMASQLADTIGKSLSDKQLIPINLRALAVLLPFLSELSPNERRKMKVIDCIRPYLLSDDEPLRYHAICCLTTYTGSPQLTEQEKAKMNGAEEQEGSTGGKATTTTTTTGTTSANPPQRFRGTLSPDEGEVIREFLSAQIQRRTQTPRLIVGCMNLLCASMFCLRGSCIPWVLSHLFDVQEKCGCDGPLASVQGSPVESSVSGGNTTKVKSNKSKSKIRPAASAGANALQQFWNLYVLSGIRSLSVVMNLKPLLDYALDIFKRRLADDPCEIPLLMEPKLWKVSCLQSGFRCAEGNETTVLDRNVVTSEVTNILSRKTVAHYLLQLSSEHVHNLQKMYGVHDSVLLCSALEGQSPSSAMSPTVSEMPISVLQQEDGQRRSVGMVGSESESQLFELHSHQSHAVDDETVQQLTLPECRRPEIIAGQQFRLESGSGMVSVEQRLMVQHPLLPLHPSAMVLPRRSSLQQQMATQWPNFKGKSVDERIKILMEEGMASPSSPGFQPALLRRVGIINTTGDFPSMDSCLKTPDLSLLQLKRTGRKLQQKLAGRTHHPVGAPARHQDVTMGLGSPKEGEMLGSSQICSLSPQSSLNVTTQPPNASLNASNLGDNSTRLFPPSLALPTAKVMRLQAYSTNAGRPMLEAANVSLAGSFIGNNISTTARNSNWGEGLENVAFPISQMELVDF